MPVPGSRPCPRHPTREATLACPECGAAICVDCGGEHDRRRYCERCLAAVLDRAVRADAARPRGASGVTVGLGAVAIVAVVCGIVYWIARPSIEHAKERARWRACEVGLRRIHDAARLYAEDQGRVLPRGEKETTDSVVDLLVGTGYLRERPNHLAPGSVSKEERTLDGDPRAPYIVDDRAHGDGKRHLLRVDGDVDDLTDAEVATELAKTTWSIVTATASVTATAVPSAHRGP